MPFVQLETARAHYEVAGAGRNVLVLVHGNFASSRWWRPVLDRLPAGWRAYAMDLRGCGETAPPPSGAAEEYSIPRLASDLAAFADRLDLPAFHVGHSLGGAVALDRLGDPRPEDALASRAAPRGRADSTRFASGNWILIRPQKDRAHWMTGKGRCGSAGHDPRSASAPAGALVASGNGGGERNDEEAGRLPVVGAGGMR